MPLIEQPYVTPILVYDAPVNEKTKQIREKFDVDDKTGYPRHYNWRSMARLGPVYEPQDPFRKFDPYNPDEAISTKVGIVFLSAASAGFIHYVWSNIRSRPYWSNIHIFLGITAGTAGFILWMHNKTLERQNLKNHIYMDYIEKHPERFGPIHRPKLREALGEYIPIR